MLEGRHPFSGAEVAELSPRLAEELGLEMPATALNMALYDKVIEAGLGNLDHSALIKAIDPD